MKRFRAALTLLLGLGSLGGFACSTTPAPTPPDVTIPIASANIVASVSPTAAKATPTAVAQAGPPCETTQDCGPQEICAGAEGCDQAWTCIPARPCTRDLMQFCGCDAKTFGSSSTCPLKKYKSRGACAP